MNRTYFLLSFLFLAIFIISCSSKSEQQSKITKINELEESIYTDTVSYTIDNDKAKQLIDLYSEFADNYPDDSLSPEYLFKAGEICRVINDGETAIIFYDKIRSQFPDFNKAPYCLFLKAFVYENDIQNLLNAKKFYTEFIEKYPNHDFADDAKALIENLGKSPEELIKSFEEKQKTDTIAAN